MAGLTVCAVALPLALAFGVSSGASAAAGLVTAILAGVVIAILGGASYQVSGPTGAMSAVLIGIVAQYGLRIIAVLCKRVNHRGNHTLHSLRLLFLHKYNRKIGQITDLPR